MRVLRSLVVILIVLSPSLLIAAETTEPPQFLTCASFRAAACHPDTPCVQGSAASVNLPIFFKIDLEQKRVISSREGGAHRTSPIRTVATGNGVMRLEGVDQGALWNMLIGKANGRMTLTVSNLDAAYVVFGACTP